MDSAEIIRSRARREALAGDGDREAIAQQCAVDAAVDLVMARANVAWLEALVTANGDQEALLEALEGARRDLHRKAYLAEALGVAGFSTAAEVDFELARTIESLQASLAHLGGRLDAGVSGDNDALSAEIEDITGRLAGLESVTAKSKKGSKK